MSLWTFNDGFESGDATGWDVAESDANSQLDFPHYSELARAGQAMPYSGAYCARWWYQSTAGASTIGTTDIAISNGETLWIKFNMYISSSMVEDSTANDGLILFDLNEADDTTTMYLGMTVFADASQKVTLGLWAEGSQTTSSTRINLDAWQTIELEVNIDTDSADGYIKLYQTSEGAEPSATVTAQVTGKQSTAAVTYALLGLTAIAGTTRGYYLIDNFVTSASRVYPDKDRFSTTKTVTRSGHVFLGPGRVSGVSLVGGDGGDETVTIYDTDTGKTQLASKKTILTVDNAFETVEAENVPFDVVRGCYVEITGTAATTDEPQVTVQIDRAPAWFSEGNMRRYALRRRV